MSKSRLTLTHRRPVYPETGVRVAPSQLEAHRRSHEFQGPCCLCAFLDRRQYTEAEIGIVEIAGGNDGEKRTVLEGEYVAICAKRRCGFFREFA